MNGHKKAMNREERLLGLKKIEELELIHQIKKLRSLPMNQRTHFLRKRLPNGGSCL